MVVAAAATLGVRSGDGTAGWSAAQIDTLRGAATWTDNTTALGIDTTNGDFTYARLIAIILQLIVVVCLMGGLWMGRDNWEGFCGRPARKAASPRLSWLSSL